MGCHFLLQGIFPTQGLNLGFGRLFTIWATRDKYRLINTYFPTLRCNLVTLFYCSNCFSFGRREPFCCLLCPIKVVYFHYIAFLPLQNTPDSSCVFRVPVLESAFSAKEPHFPLLQKAVLEVSFWVLYAHCWMLLIILFICLSWQSRKIHVYSVIYLSIYLSIHLSINTSICNYVHIYKDKHEFILWLHPQLIILPHGFF